MAIRPGRQDPASRIDRTDVLQPPGATRHRVLIGLAKMAFTDTEGGTQTSLSEINLTPFVDALLVLLVIFMLAAPILQSGIELDVPQTRTVREISQERLVGS